MKQEGNKRLLESVAKGPHVNPYVGNLKLVLTKLV